VITITSSINENPCSRFITSGSEEKRRPVE
jgi:hypothetical protein